MTIPKFYVPHELHKDQHDLAMEYMLKQAKAQENFVACYLKETGLSIEDVMLVEHPSADGRRIEWSCMPTLKVREKVMETPVDVKKAKQMKEDLEKSLSAELTSRIGEFEKATGLVVRNVEAFTVHELIVGEGTPKFVFAEVGLGVEI